MHAIRMRYEKLRSSKDIKVLGQFFQRFGLEPSIYVQFNTRSILSLNFQNSEVFFLRRNHCKAHFIVN